MISADVFVVVFVLLVVVLALGLDDLNQRTEKNNLRAVAMKWRARAARPCDRCNERAHQLAVRRQQERTRR